MRSAKIRSFGKIGTTSSPPPPRIPGVEALEADPYPIDPKRRAKKVLAGSQDIPRGHIAPLHVQDEVQQYIQDFRAKQSQDLTIQAESPRFNTTSLKMSSLYKQYHERYPDDTPFPPPPDLLLSPGRRPRSTPTIPSVQDINSIHKQRHNHRLHTILRNSTGRVSCWERITSPIIDTFAARAERSRNPRLCKDCQLIDFGSFFGDEEPPRSWLVHPREKLRNRYDECRFCRFLCGAALQHEISFTMKETFVPIFLSRDTNMKLFTTMYGDLDDTLSSGQNLSRNACTIIPRTDCGVPCLEARLVADSYTSKSSLKARIPSRHLVDISLIRSWLGFCETRHVGVCGSLPWRPNTTLPNNFRVIDVRTSSIVKAPAGCRYLAHELCCVDGPRAFEMSLEALEQSSS